MSCNPAKSPCPPSCPKVKEQLRIAIKELPNVTDGIFPREKNDVKPRLPPDVISRDIPDEAAHVDKVPVDRDVRPEVLKDVETEPSVSEEFPTREPTVVPTEKTADDVGEKIYLIEKEKLTEPTIVQEETVTTERKDRDEKRNDFVEEKELVPGPAVPKETVSPTERIADRDETKIGLVAEKELVEEPTIIPEETVTPTEKIVDLDEKKIDFVEEEAVTPPAKIDWEEEKIDLITEEKLDKKPVTVQEETVIPTERTADRDDEKIDFVEEEDRAVEGIAAESVRKVPITIEEPEIIEDEMKLAPTTKIELETSRELEEQFEPEERMEYGEEEESVTDYEKFIDEELQESLPAVIAREIPEEPRAVRREISRNAATLYERIDRERPVRPPREREAVTAMPEERPAEEEVSARRALESSTTEQIVSRKPEKDACEETCPLAKEQKERIMRKLKVRQRVVDHYYLTKGFSYFEDVCTCSLACMVYTLSRDPFVKSIFASLALFAVGLKLCSELDAWEMPSRVS